MRSSAFVVPCATGMVLACVNLAAGFDSTFADYNRVLAKYVCPEGVVYGEIAGDPLIAATSDDLASLSEQRFSALPQPDQIAYLINVYNFHTIALIVKHYPLKTGIHDIDRPWDTEFVPLFGARVSLNHIEHDLLRKRYHEPRIHFALNCASKGCPPLEREAYAGATLDSQLTAAAKRFLGDPTRNRAEGAKLFLSEIFKWYGSDFDVYKGGYVEYVKSILGLQGTCKVKFLDYDWSLNAAPPCGGR